MEAAEAQFKTALMVFSLFRAVLFFALCLWISFVKI